MFKKSEFCYTLTAKLSYLKFLPSLMAVLIAPYISIVLVASKNYGMAAFFSVFFNSKDNYRIYLMVNFDFREVFKDQINCSVIDI